MEIIAQYCPKKKLLFPSWTAVHCVDWDDDDDAEGACKKRPAPVNIAPGLAACLVLCVAARLVYCKGLAGSWAACLYWLNVPSARHVRTRFIAGDIECVESVLGVVHALSTDRMPLLWAIAAGVSFAVCSHPTATPKEQDPASEDPDS
ncbi:hypothetical protein DIPPA_09485 [Diplonema papillatum]|nr:hypothetical protein DIPPA_09485 [Diplonema papillatum]